MTLNGNNQAAYGIGRELMRKCFVDKDEEACRVLRDILKSKQEQQE